MSRAHFLKGVKVRIDGREYRLLREIAPGRWQLEAADSGELRNHTRNELQDLYLAGRFEFLVDQRGLLGDVAEKRRENAAHQFELLAPKRQETAKARRRYVTEVIRRAGPKTPLPLIDAIAKSVWAELHWPSEGPPHRTTIWRWLKRYLPAGKDVRSLVDRVHACGNRESRLPERLVEILREAIDRVYLTEERQTLRDTYDHALTEVKRENALRVASDQLPQPTLRQVKRMIEAIPEYDRYVARHGRLAAEHYFRSVLKKPVTSAPLERVEIDHTRLDLFVIDEETLLPLGRPWLTLAIDVHTRAILGFDLGFDPPSHASVARCLKQALLPKAKISETYRSVEHDWDMHGVMDTLVTDNGTEFHSESLEAGCLTLGITIQYCPRKQPWFKGTVERALGSLNRGVAHGVPGTTFSNIVAKEDYNAAKKATITLETLRERIHIWICDYYHQRPHRGLGDTPSHAWSVGTAGMSIPLPANPKELDANLGKVATNRLTRKGIELNYLFYHSPALAEVVARLGHDLEVTVRHHDDDLGGIHVLVPDTGEYLPVPAIDQDYARGLTLWQHKVCKRFARRELGGRTDATSLAEAKRRIRELVQDDFARKRKGTRIGQYRFLKGGGGQASAAPAKVAAAPPVRTEAPARPALPSPVVVTASPTVPKLTALRVPPVGVQTPFLHSKEA